MNTLDQSLVSLVERGLVTPEDAKVKAKDPGEFMRLLQLMASTPTAHAGPQIQPPGQAVVQGGVAPPPGTGDGSVPAPPPQQGPVRGQPNRPGYRKE